MKMILKYTFAAITIGLTTAAQAATLDCHVSGISGMAKVDFHKTAELTGQGVTLDLGSNGDLKVTAGALVGSPADSGPVYVQAASGNQEISNAGTGSARLSVRGSASESLDYSCSVTN